MNRGEYNALGVYIRLVTV